MTHDELLAICDNYSFKDSAEPVKALRAVVELHKPVNVYLPNGRGEKIDVCEDCQNDIGQTIYPCPTIQAIEKELK